MQLAKIHARVDGSESARHGRSFIVMRERENDRHRDARFSFFAHPAGPLALFPTAAAREGMMQSSHPTGLKLSLVHGVHVDVGRRELARRRRSPDSEVSNQPATCCFQI